MLKKLLLSVQNKKAIVTRDTFFPDGVSQIIQGYLSDEKPEGGSLSSLLFFGKEILLFAHKAAYYAVWGKPNEFKAIAARCPDALLSKVAMKGPNGCMVGSPWQLLLHTDDNYIRDAAGHTFLEMARSYLFCDDVRKEKAKIQEEEWFQGWDEKAHIKELEDEFDKVAKAFDESEAKEDKVLSQDAKLQEAIKYFETYLRDAVLRAKKNCIRHIWDYATQFYTYEKYDAYHGHNSDKNRLFCFRVLGSLDVNSPGWGMQVLSYGICSAIEQKTECPRNDVSSYYDTSTDDTCAKFCLGINSYMNTYGAHLGYTDKGVGGGAGRGRDGVTFQSYVDTCKKAECPSYKTGPVRASTLVCSSE